MDESVSHALGRMDWEFGNPNKTATLIALIMLAVWALAYFRHWGFWAALTLFTGFGFCLILTQSRGGVVGLLAGCAFLVGWAPRPFSIGRILAVVVSCIVLIGFSFIAKADSRYAQGLESDDLSIANRLLIWKQVPAMIHDAPNGWGLGKSGDAFMQWYQPINRGEGYRTLVNSHLTWLVELNWWGRSAYVLAWVAVLILLWPCSEYRWFSIPFALWIALAICASFSSVAEAPLLWIIPLTALIRVIIARWEEKKWPLLIHWISGGLVSALIIGGVIVGGVLTADSSQAHCPQKGIVILGNKSPGIWIVSPNKTILGEHYGHEVRRAFATDSFYRKNGVAVVTEMKSVSRNQVVVFSGQVPTSLGTLMPSQVILINPKPVESESLQNLATIPHVTVVVGEYSKNKDYWSQQAKSHPNIKTQLVTGNEEYISNWMNEVAMAFRD